MPLAHGHEPAVPLTIAMGGGSLTAPAADGSRPLRRHPEWIRARLRSRGELPRAQGPAARPEPQHGLRRGALPQHRRVLGAAHRDDHDPGRHLHPCLRLLRRQDRTADLERRGRAPPRGRGALRPGPGARGRDERRPRRPAGWRRAHLRQHHPRAARGLPGHGRGGADPRLQRRPTSRCGRSWTAGPDILNHNVETVERLQKPVRKRARYHRSLDVLARAKVFSREIDRPGRHRPHQVEPDGRPGRDARRAVAGLPRPAGGRLRHPDHRPVPAAARRRTCRSIATCIPTSSPR